MCYVRQLSAVCPVCNVGVLWPNAWMNQYVTWYGGRPRPRRHCVRSPTCWVMSVVAKRSPMSELLIMMYNSVFLCTYFSFKPLRYPGQCIKWLKHTRESWMIFGLLSEYCGANVVNIWRNLDKISRYMSPKTGVEFQNESHVKFTVCDLLHVFINLLMLELVFCVFCIVYICITVNLSTWGL